ncbi:MAG: class I SAM-dependent methyltransferase [Saprospiraceae bacterium]|jgi:SAM-dependent methyltransferase|nr:class I SAM-dependent methyltransferase [Saprospiraceae bacterium]
MISKWILKAIVQKTISYLPYSQRINYFFQKYVTKGVQLSDAYFEDRLGHAKTHIEAWEQFSGGRPLRSTLELGAGWYPVVPIALYLYGAETIRTADITLLSDAGHLRTTISKFLEYAERGRLTTWLSFRPDRLEQLRALVAGDKPADFETLARTLHIEYLIQDARHLPLPDGSIDLVHSNNTFEHIYPDILIDLLREFKRIVRPGGVQSHFIDLSDHFAHFDTSITIYHFLRFSPAAWRWIDNSIQPLNRLRITDYRRLYREAGIPVDKEVLRPGNVEELRKGSVDASFLQNTEEENAVSHGHFVSRQEL